MDINPLKYNNFVRYFHFLSLLMDIEDSVDLVFKTGNNLLNSKFKIIDIDAKKIKFNSRLFNHEGKIIVYIDFNKITDKQEYLVLTKKMRHAYQLIAIKENLEDPKLLKEWQKSLFSKIDCDDYNWLDIDSITFAHHILDNVLNLDVNYKNYDDIHQDYLDKIICDYDKRSVELALLYSQFNNNIVTQELCIHEAKARSIMS